MIAFDLLGGYVLLSGHDQDDGGAVDTQRGESMLNANLTRMLKLLLPLFCIAAHGYLQDGERAYMVKEGQTRTVSCIEAHRALLQPVQDTPICRSFTQSTTRLTTASALQVTFAKGRLAALGR